MARAADGDPHLRGVRALARLLDEAIPIPGTGIRFGLDPILGLVPGAGDLAGGVLSAWVVVVAARRGAPASLLARMVGNVVLDSLVGSVPALGDLFDAGFKANTRNVRLLERHLDLPGDAARASRASVALALLALLLVLGASIALSVFVARWIWTAVMR